MNDKYTVDRRAEAARRRGLLIALAASLVLIVLAAYRLPLFQTELHGVIVGVSEVHSETGTELIAVVELDTGAQVLVPIPGGLLTSGSNNVSINEMRTLFGRKSYRIIEHNN